MNDIRRPAALILIIAVLAIALVVISQYGDSAHTSHPQVPATATIDPLHPPLPPKPTAADLVSAQNPHGFQALVSYTDHGFEPTAATIHKGDTVRFTNNSSEGMWIAASDAAGALYPATQNGCGSSALDSCAAIEQGRYWEFTFNETGTWSFRNNADPSKGGEVSVVVR